MSHPSSKGSDELLQQHPVDGRRSVAVCLRLEPAKRGTAGQRFIALDRRLPCQIVPERVVVIEADMILPKNALLKHAMHTDDIVGSVYVQHSPPFLINAQWQAADGSRKWGHPTPESWRGIFDQGPALVKCDVVGLGCTSIARKVIEEWPEDTLMFWNDYSRDDKGDPTTLGEVSHDVWFCTHARDLGYNVYLDTSIQCAQLTEGEVTVANYVKHHPDAFRPKKMLVPRGPGSERGRS